MNPVGWFEVPVSDMNRAIVFYNAVFGWSLEVNKMGPFRYGLVSIRKRSVRAAGTLVYHKEHYTPSSSDGVLVYFSCDDVATALQRVENAGGRVLQPKTQITEEIGFMGMFLDSEGNRIALHSVN